MDEKAPKIIKELIERFQRNLSEYKIKGYNEAQLRQEFINPFFEALGWDVYNKSGAAPAYRDVIHEDSIKITGGTKAPDYCFTLSGRRMFFVEAKKPAVGIVSDSNPAYQLRRYAWSAELSLSILTNFEDLCIYESRQKPHVGDKTSVERVKHIKYTEYVERWNEIASVFSYSSVKQGSFDLFAKSVEKKRGTQEVGGEFLKEIEEWREKLAKNIAIRNSNLGVRELNFCVQKTIDRIIFLRMCEDRGIETYGQLRSIAEKDRVYENLCKIFKKADEKYNSGLFHFRKEKGRGTLLDELTLSLLIDDAILKNIFRHLYYPNCPYEFSVLPPEILGNVYEQFLGKIIRLTGGHRAKIEEKPEVKKAGGVYYTPTYIVDYIVQSTIKKLCDGKTPKQISNIRILDPACGSGSFLLGAYSHLLDYHLNYYTKNKKPKRLKDQIYQGKDDQWFLTIKEKKRILLNNIYGVDIDNQAVEVTKLSLLLKVLEGASRDIFEKQQKLWTERVLPDLVNNIKCGNSLIGTDFYESSQTKLIENNEEMCRINAFDWKVEFEEIMDAGGFDVVIGNPPYVRQEMLGTFKEYFKKFYHTYHGVADLYIYFIERGVSLLKPE
jgi:predicted type IV restriction endonuclease